MDLAIVVYLIGLVDNLSFVSGLFSFISIVSLIVFSVACSMAHSNAACNYDKLPNANEAKTIEVSKKGIKASLIVLLITTTISIFTPSKTDMYLSLIHI